MEELTVNIVDCTINSFKLKAESIDRYYDEALENARSLYLDLHDEAYRDLMFDDFNPMWTPDRQATNDIDPKDGFWSMYVLLFNACLIEILNEKFTIRVFDQTSSEFRNQKHFFNFLKHEGIKYTINAEKRNNHSFKHSLKLFVINSISTIKETISDTILFFRQEFFKSDIDPEVSLKSESEKKTIYLAIPPVNDTDIKFYLGWRYKNIFKTFEQFQNQGFRILLVAIKDHEGLGGLQFPSINALSLVGKKEKAKIFVLSIVYKLRVLFYVWSKLLRTKEPLKKYFLKNIPTDLYYAIKENRAFNNLFKTFGRGLWIMKGPTVYKGICMRNYNAWNNGVRTLTISARLMTSTRLTNSFLKSHTDSQFPHVLPHSIYVKDMVSYNTIKDQTDRIDIYATKIADEYWEGSEEDRDHHEPFSVTLILQKKNEMESMIESAYSSTKDLENVVLNLKAHPDFPIPKRIGDKYEEKPDLKILPNDTSLTEAVELSDLCISSYSSAVFEFAKNKKPIIWLNNVTLNSLLVTDAQRKVGVIANNNDELKELIQKMKSDSSFYQEMKEEQSLQFKNFVNEIDDEMSNSLFSVIEKELNKV